MPTATPVTKPVLTFIVAFAGVAETHAFVVAGVAVPYNCSVAPTQTEAVGIEAPPLVKDIVGSGFTVILPVALSVAHPVNRML